MMPMRRVAEAFVLFALVSCGARATTTPEAPLAPAADVPTVPVPPSLARDGMAESTAQVDATAVAADAIHPDVLAQALGEAGFRAGSERVATGGDGPFSRIVVRRLRFADEAGAASFVDWIGANAGTEFFPVEALELPGTPEDVLLLRHVPDGCCPREIRIYLAAWQRGDEVVVVTARGPRSTDPAMVNLVDQLTSNEGS